MNNDKYAWGMELQLPKIEPHSIKKHELIKKYIIKYVLTVMSKPTIPELKLSIIDGFAGGGAYNNQGQVHYGSPIVIIEALREAEALININRNKARKISYDLYFVEKNKEYIAFLKNTVENYLNTANHSCIHFVHADFNQILPQLINWIKARNSSQRAVFILDQFAYKDVPIQNIRSIFSLLKKPEVILTFNIGSLVTYFTESSERKTTLENIGLGHNFPWEQFREVKDTQYRNAFIQFYITKAILQASGAEYITPFFFSRETPNSKGRHNYFYWLIHLSNTYRANDVMKSLHWDMQNDFCHTLELGIFGYNTNYDNELSSQHLLNFGENHAFDQVSAAKSIEILHEQINKTLHSNEGALKLTEVLHKIANHSMANESLVKKTLELGIQLKDIKVVDKKGEKQRYRHTTIKTSDILMPLPQKRFFF